MSAQDESDVHERQQPQRLPGFVEGIRLGIPEGKKMSVSDGGVHEPQQPERLPGFVVALLRGSDDGGVHERQQPWRLPDFAKALLHGCAGAVSGGLCGAVSTVVTFWFALQVVYANKPGFGPVVGFPVAFLFVGAGIGAVFGAALQAAKGGFEWGVFAGCLGGVLTGAFPLIELLL
jgi:hypothetical protein